MLVLFTYGVAFVIDQFSRHKSVRRMTSPLNFGHRYGLEVARLIGLSPIIVLLVFLPDSLWAQAMGMGSKTPPNLPTAPTSSPVTDILRNPDGWAITVPSQLGAEAPQGEAVPQGEAAPTPCPGVSHLQPSGNPFLRWLQEWTLDLSMLYQFSNERSRVGEFSWDINSVGIDLAASFNERPYTSLSVSYVYSHWNGWSPKGENDITNQHIGSVRILQPLDNIWCHNWRPADQSDIAKNNQLAILLGTAYGGSLGRLATPNFALLHETSYSLVGDTFLDYQFAWFPQRYVPEKLFPENAGGVSEKLLAYRDCNTYNYPNLVFEFSTGPQFSTVRIESSGSGGSPTTSGRQFDYVNSAILTGSSSCRLGFLVAVTWDAPFDSQPVRGGKSRRANTATFTGGLVYNLFPSTDPGVFHHPSLERLSLSLLYSYTAFDPLTETNTIQVQASYSF